MNNSRQATAEELRSPTKFNYVQLTAEGATAVTMIGTTAVTMIGQPDITGLYTTRLPIVKHYPIANSYTLPDCQ